MTVGLPIEDPPTFTTRVEAVKAASDNGYRVIREIAQGWMGFGSTSAPCNIFIARALAGPWLLSVEHTGVAQELSQTFGSSQPGPGVYTCLFPTLSELHHAIDRTYRLSISLPQILLANFEQQTSNLPRSTEAERLVIMRVGQEIFRQALMEYWNGTCPLTGITDPALLRASHIVPWAECETDALRLNVYNGLLLSSLWDAAFDAGLVSFTACGIPLVSAALSQNAVLALGLGAYPLLRGLTPQHEVLLKRHRERNGNRSIDLELSKSEPA
jgi:hypothetical protein